MPTSAQTAVYSLFGVGILLLGAACQIEPWPANATREVPSGREPKAAAARTLPASLAVRGLSRRDDELSQEIHS